MGRPSMYLQPCHWELSTMLQVIDQVHLSSKSVVKLHCCPETIGQSRASSKRKSGCFQGSRLQASQAKKGSGQLVRQEQLLCKAAAYLR